MRPRGACKRYLGRLTGRKYSLVIHWPTLLPYHLHVLSRDRGEVRPLSRRNKVYDTSPAVSPEGEWIAFTRFDVSERLSRLMLQKLGSNLTPAEEPRTVVKVPPGILHSLLVTRQ
jgi:hypothetical protein